MTTAISRLAREVYDEAENERFTHVSRFKASRLAKIVLEMEEALEFAKKFNHNGYEVREGTCACIFCGTLARCQKIAEGRDE